MSASGGDEASQYKKRFSSEPLPVRSKAGELTLPGRDLRCCLSAGWTSLRIQAFESQGKVEPFETPAPYDQLVVVTTQGQGKVECFSGGFWRGAVYYPGTGGMTPSGQTSRLRWDPHGSEALKTLHLHVPNRFFVEAQDEYRRTGTLYRKRPLNALSFYDPVVLRVALSLADAAQMGAPDLYAQSAAQFLAVHLLSMQSGWPDISQDARRPGTLENRRLAHVLEYMNLHYKDALSLDTLAEEAGVSRFHFVRLFKEKVGFTPHRYLVKIRMEAAAALLRDTDLSVKEIAFACGYQSAAHFSAAFQKYFSQSPRLYR